MIRRAPQLTLAALPLEDEVIPVRARLDPDAAPSPELASLGEWIARMDAKPSVTNDLADMMQAIARVNAA